MEPPEDAFVNECAQRSSNYSALLQRIAELEAALEEIAQAGVKFTTTMDYVVVHVDRVTWDKLQELRRRSGKEEKG